MLFKAVPTKVCIGLALAIVLDTGVQICWKFAVSQADQNLAKLANPLPIDTLLLTAQQPLFWATAVMFTLQLINWLKVLEDSDLSYSQPITSLSYISVLVLSAMFLKESITISQVIGITSILVGVWFICRGQHNTDGAVLS